MEALQHFDLEARVTRAAAKVRLVFDAENPHFKNEYATLGQVMKKLEPALAEEGLGYFQTPGGDGTTTWVETRVFCYETGAVLSGKVVIPMDRQNAVGAGSALSYARRYGLLVMCKLLAEDDDGEGDRKAREQPRAEAPAAGAPKGWKAALSADLMALGMQDIVRALKATPDFGLTEKDAPMLRKLAGLAARSPNRADLVRMIVEAIQGGSPIGYLVRLTEIEEDNQAIGRTPPDGAQPSLPADGGTF